MCAVPAWSPSAHMPAGLLGKAPHTPPLFPSPFFRSTFQRLVMNNLSDFFKESIRFLKGCKTPGDQRAWRAAARRRDTRAGSPPLPPHSPSPATPPHPLPSAAFAMVLGMTGVGALGMGLISFVVKVVHIPLTQVLVLKTE